MLLIKATRGKTVSWYWAGTILYWFAYTWHWRIDILWRGRGNLFPCTSSRMNIDYECRIVSLAGCKLRTQAPEYQASLPQAAVSGKLDTAPSVKHELLLATRYHTPSTTADRLNLASTYIYCSLYAGNMVLRTGSRVESNYLQTTASVGIRLQMHSWMNGISSESSPISIPTKARLSNIDRMLVLRSHQSIFFQQIRE